VLDVGTVFAADVAAVRIGVLGKVALANRTCGTVEEEASDLGIVDRRREDCCILMCCD
jgi:hypothetical protein